jgi:hypothetical protein
VPDLSRHPPTLATDPGRGPRPDSAPDLVEPVVGFRAWRVIEDRLLSPYIPCRWDGRVMHAECYPANRSVVFERRGWLGEPHEVPNAACQCGIYAYHRPGVRATYGEFDWLEGIVTVWGRIEVHRDGLRAEHARVEALALPPAGEARRRACAHAIAAHLGVELVERGDLATAAECFGAPLPLSLVPTDGGR